MKKVVDLVIHEHSVNSSNIRLSYHEWHGVGDQWSWDVEHYVRQGNYSFAHDNLMRYIVDILDKLNSGDWIVSDAGLICKEVAELHPVKFDWLGQ